MENQNELMHYGVLGMKWGVKRGTRQLSKATTPKQKQKSVATLEKHKGKAIKKLERANRIFGSDSNWGSKVTESSMNRAKKYIKNKYKMSSLTDINNDIAIRQFEMDRQIYLNNVINTNIRIANFMY